MVNSKAVLILVLAAVCINAETCKEKYDRITAEWDKREKESGHPIFGIMLPTCESDGTYAPVQWVNGGASCVTAEGIELIPWTQSRVKMNCLCVRAKDEARGRRGAEFNCNPVTGNYKPKQCRGSVCFCSDPEGNQVGKDVPRNKELTC